jgi:hypothetical protein
MSCGSGGWRFPTEEVRERYINDFTLEGDPRPKDTNERPLFAYPAAWLRPCSCERGACGRELFRFFGAFALRAFLKRFQCYPPTIRGTVRGTPERQRALIATIPVTIGRLINFCAALAMSLPNIIRDNASDGGDDLMQMLLGMPLLVLNVVLIYSIHILPVLVQRLNRAELYNAIVENQRETA